MPRRRRRRRGGLSRRALYWIGGVAAVIVLLPVAAIAILLAMVDPNAYKAQIQAAVRQSLGRELRVNGAITFSPSLSPEMVANNITLSNMADGSRPDMARIDQADIELSLRALLAGRFVIARMTLLRPDILLETDASGRGNWQFDRPAAAKTSAAPHAGTPSLRIQPDLSLQTVHIRDGRVTWRDGRTGRAMVFDVRRVAAIAASADTPVLLGAEVVIGRQQVTLSAQTAPLAQLASASVQTPWTLFANIANNEAKLTVTGSFTRPLEGRGYSLRIDGNIPDLMALSWLSPVPLPPLHSLDFTGRVLDQGGAMPDISLVTIKAGLTNLDQISPGFTLDSARIDMPRLSEPVVVAAEGNFAGAPFSINGTIGAPALLLPGAKPGQAFNLDLTAEAGGASFGVRGVIASPGSQSGLDMALGARVPDLSVLSPLAGRLLPPLKTIAFSSNLVDSPGGGYAHGFTLKDIVLTLPQGDLAGDISLTTDATPQGATRGEPRPRLVAVLKSGRLDIDGLLAALASGNGADLGGLMPAPRDTAASLDVTEPLAVPPFSNTVISDTKLPLAGLKLGDADVRMTVGELDAGGNVVRNLAVHAVLKDGALQLDPLTGDLPGGQLAGRLDLDSRQPSPPLALFLTAQGIDVKPLVAEFGQGGALSGKADLRVDLHAAGNSLHALAASLDGHAGVALTNGDIDNAVLGAAISGVLKTARLLLATPAGRTALRCVAIRLNAAHGIVTFAPAVLDSPRLLLNVSGTVNLADETLALRLRPLLRVGGPGVVVPVRLDGDFNDPKLVLDNANAGRSAVLALLGGRAGGAKGTRAATDGEQGGDACGPALAAVQAASASPLPQPLGK